MVKPTEEQLTIRAMQVDDVPSVFDIERESFNDSSWTIDAFYHELNENNFKSTLLLFLKKKLLIFRIMDSNRSSSNYNHSNQRIIQRLWIRSAITKLCDGLC